MIKLSRSGTAISLECDDAVPLNNWGRTCGKREEGVAWEEGVNPSIFSQGDFFPKIVLDIFLNNGSVGIFLRTHRKLQDI